MMKRLRSHKDSTAVNLALGSGAARGLAHIGVLKVLDKKGIKIRKICGTSIGALIGGLYAAGLSSGDIEKVILGLDRKKLLSFFMPSFNLSGFLDGGEIMEFIRSVIGNPVIEKLSIPFSAVATDVMTGKEHLFVSGSLLAGIRSSICIPGIFATCRIGKK